jgi:deoxyribodipyrimidine photo-lyase
MTTTTEAEGGVIVVLFHRDLRIVDHNTLREAAAAAKGGSILPLFIFTPDQATEKNPLRSVNSVQFMLESLKDLQSAIAKDGGKLIFAYGETEAVLRSLHRRVGFRAIYETADYTPYAKRRGAALAALAKGLKTGFKSPGDLKADEAPAAPAVEYVAVHDSYLLAPGTLKNAAGKTFQKFTPFYETARHRRIPMPHSGRVGVRWWRPGVQTKGPPRRATRRVARLPGEVTLEAMTRRLVPRPNAALAVHGGRTEGLRLLAELPRNYARIHDVPSERTSMLSAHNHFGTVSIREVHARGTALGLTEFVRQLWWRDFYGHIMADFETLYGVGAYEFQAKAPAQSERAKKAFRDWCAARTGVPLVDAGMRELLTTGYMHNRVRLVVASWLTKDMGVHWRLGERFFAKHLVDYDPAQNMMNWIWVASKLPFASAPFRRVDAYTTAKKFDPDGKYVAKWGGSKSAEGPEA